MSDSADPMLAHGREVLASQPFSVLASAAMAAPVVASGYKINYLRPAIGDTLIACLGEGR
ncbi:hypothetical protein [Cupriavidus sp. YAF13]|uniref:hypothetical protein n=1 Tax=Cupriavidus sp. YAF13 TaxID=3233075 RepID=UPI003F8F363F